MSQRDDDNSVDDLDRQVDELGKRTVADAHRARAADQPTLRLAEQLSATLRAQRMQNHWATKVRQAFRESHG